MHVDVHVEQGEALNGRPLLQLAEGGVIDLVTDSRVSKLQSELLASEVLQVLLPQVTTRLERLNGEGNECFLFSLQNYGHMTYNDK